MKKSFIVISFCLIFVPTLIYSQNKNAPKSIISKTAVIKKYYDRKELAGLSKNELVDLCIERVGVLTKIAPYVSFATKPGATMTDFGIPNSSEYKNVFDDQEKNIDGYLDSLNSFQRKILPYSDKDDLIKAVLFYESILKLLNEFKDL